MNKIKIKRKKTKIIHIGGAAVGGANPISIQSMTKTDTKDVSATVKQIHELENLGCEIIRVAVPDMESAESLPQIIKKIHIPLIADIHFNWRLAVKSIEAGAHGIRINPGNMKELREIVNAAKERNVPIRIGVNSGSLDKKYKKVNPEALVDSAMEYIKRIEDMGFTKLKISVKAPSIFRTIEAYRLLSKKTRYPLHIGVTEAGPLVESAVRSSIALGTLLMEGIGDTMRVSVTGEPHSEIIIAKEILQSLGLRKFGPEIISCPTCARCDVDLINIVEEVKKKIPHNGSKVKSIAIMGCVVNGPGEAKDAAIGVACGKGSAVLFKNGKPVQKIKETEILDTLIKEISSR